MLVVGNHAQFAPSTICNLAQKQISAACDVAICVERSVMAAERVAPIAVSIPGGAADSRGSP